MAFRICALDHRTSSFAMDLDNQNESADELVVVVVDAIAENVEDVGDVVGAAGVVDDHMDVWASSGCLDVHTSWMSRLVQEELECTCSDCPECISYLRVLIGIAFHVVNFQHSTYGVPLVHTV